MLKRVSDTSFEFVEQFREDVAQAVLTLGRLAHGETAHQHLKLDLSYLLENARKFTYSDKCAFWLAWEDEKPVGVFAGKVTDYFFSKDLVAGDSLWYVVSEKRGSRIGLELLNLFEKWAKDQGVVDIRIGQTSKLDPSVFNGILKSRGYDCVGSYFVRKVSDV